MTRRRDFLMLTGAAALWPLSAYAQQRKVVKIGFLTVKPQVEPHWGLVRSALRDLGYAEGMNVQFDLRAASPRFSMRVTRFQSRCARTCRRWRAHAPCKSTWR